MQPFKFNSLRYNVTCCVNLCCHVCSVVRVVPQDVYLVVAYMLPKSWLLPQSTGTLWIYCRQATLTRENLIRENRCLYNTTANLEILPPRNIPAIRYALVLQLLMQCTQSAVALVQRTCRWLTQMAESVRHLCFLHAIESSDHSSPAGVRVKLKEVADDSCRLLQVS